MPFILRALTILRLFSFAVNAVIAPRWGSEEILNRPRTQPVGLGWGSPGRRPGGMWWPQVV